MRMVLQTAKGLAFLGGAVALFDAAQAQTTRTLADRVPAVRLCAKASCPAVNGHGLKAGGSVTVQERSGGYLRVSAYLDRAQLVAAFGEATPQRPALWISASALATQTTPQTSAQNAAASRDRTRAKRRDVVRALSRLRNPARPTFRPDTAAARALETDPAQLTETDGAAAAADGTRAAADARARAELAEIAERERQAQAARQAAAEANADLKIVTKGEVTRKLLSWEELLAEVKKQGGSLGDRRAKEANGTEAKRADEEARDARREREAERARIEEARAKEAQAAEARRVAAARERREREARQQEEADAKRREQAAAERERLAARAKAEADRKAAEAGEREVAKAAKEAKRATATSTATATTARTPTGRPQGAADQTRKSGGGAANPVRTVSDPSTARPSQPEPVASARVQLPAVATSTRRPASQGTQPGEGASRTIGETKVASLPAEAQPRARAEAAAAPSADRPARTEPADAYVPADITQVEAVSIGARPKTLTKALLDDRLAALPGSKTKGTEREIAIALRHYALTLLQSGQCSGIARGGRSAVPGMLYVACTEDPTYLRQFPLREQSW